MYEQLTKNERLDKVVEMIDALRSEVVGIKNDLASTSTSTETVEEIIMHNGLKLRKVNRVGREGEYVKIIKSWDSDLKTGGFYKIECEDDELGIKDDDGFFWEGDHEDFEHVETYEIIDVQPEKLPFLKVELTANQKRAALIEKAKKFIEELKIKHFRNTYEYSGVHEVQAHFHRKNNRVTCVLNGFFTGKTYNVGRANCAPGDVFNADIGKAIALARALEIDVPREFLEAVQPNEIVVGQIVSNNVSADFYRVTSARMGVNDAFNLEMFEASGDVWEYARNLIIIDDTDAQYEVV